MAAKLYRRLPGRGTSLLHYISLYEGRDHLLQVASTGWSESYKRFYYADIQAIIVRRTALAVALNWSLGSLTLLCLLFAVLLWGSSQAGGSSGAIAMLVLTCVFGLPLLVNLVSGPTCTCHIATAVHEERLLSLGRLNRVRRVLRRIQPRIEQAQGMLPAAPEPAQPDQPLSPTAPSQPPSPAPPGAEPPITGTS